MQLFNKTNQKLNRHATFARESAQPPQFHLQVLRLQVFLDGYGTVPDPKRDATWRVNGIGSARLSCPRIQSDAEHLHCFRVVVFT